MMNVILKIAILASCAASLSFSLGCAPRTIVRKNPCDSDPGIRFYRPKPYLLVLPGESSVRTVQTQGEMASTSTTTTPGSSDRVVTLQLEYLPDFSEEYAIEVKPGVGTNQTDISLENGWNLTSVDQNLDSQTDENLNAFSDLVGAIAPALNGAVATSSSPATGNVTTMKTRTFSVQATNVPLGYYESVIGKSGGKKRLYGWRYVGFAPYLQCPADAGNSQCLDCETQGLFGLVFRNGVMTFATLDNIGAGPNLSPIEAGFDSEQVNVTPAPASQQADSSALTSWNTFLDGLARNEGISSGVEIQKNGDKYELLYSGVDASTIMKFIESIEEKFPQTKDLITPKERPSITGDGNGSSSRIGFTTTR